jgi:hypothetical protein
MFFVGKFRLVVANKHRHYLPNNGNRFSIAISCARKFFLAVIGNQAPFTVASFATTIHCFAFDVTYFYYTTPPEGQPPCSLYILTNKSANFNTLI